MIRREPKPRRSGGSTAGPPISDQNSRNQLLKTEIVKLDDQIKEIDKLRDQIAQVLARKQVVETLQANRNEAVHLIDQLVRQLPDGIYLRSVRQSGAKVTLVGYAQSNARVSTLMRSIDRSPWLGSPELVEIKLVPVPPVPGGVPKAQTGDRINEFTMNVQVRRTASVPTELKPAAGAAPAKPVPAAPATPPKPGAPTKAALAPEVMSAAGPSQGAHSAGLRDWSRPAAVFVSAGVAIRLGVDPHASREAPRRWANAAPSGGSAAAPAASVGADRA